MRKDVVNENQSLKNNELKTTTMRRFENTSTKAEAIAAE
jgi:hypothetical protein